MNKNQELMEDFARYCSSHPDERFWQALRNWSEVNFIYVSPEIIDEASAHDTFSWEGKNG